MPVRADMFSQADLHTQLYLCKFFISTRESLLLPSQTRNRERQHTLGEGPLLLRQLVETTPDFSPAESAQAAVSCVAEGQVHRARPFFMLFLGLTAR